MQLPRTSVIVAALTASTIGALGWAQTTYHWTDPQLGAASGAALSTIGLVAFLVEHFRRETPSRWVGVLGMIPPEVSAVVLLGITFAWWDESAVEVSGLVLAILAPICAILGVSIAQAKIYSPETATKNVVDVAAAQAVDPETHAR